MWLDIRVEGGEEEEGRDGAGGAESPSKSITTFSHRIVMLAQVMIPLHIQ